MDKTPPESENTISFAQTVSVTCPECGQCFEGQCWQIVDTVERPDLLERIREGTLNPTPCPQCSHSGHIYGPLLVYHADADPRVLFSPAERASDEENREYAIDLVNRLREALGDRWRDEWVAEDIRSVSQHVLLSMLCDDSEAALRELQTQASGGDGIDIPDQLRADFQQAQEGAQRYVRTGDREGLNTAAAAWERVMNHAGFLTAIRSGLLAFVKRILQTRIMAGRPLFIYPDSAFYRINPADRRLHPKRSAVF